MDSTMIIADVQPIARQIVYVQLVEMIGVLLLLVGTLLAVLIVLRVVCLLVVMLKPLFRGTGYDENQSTQGDFASDIYVIEEV